MRLELRYSQHAQSALLLDQKRQITLRGGFYDMSYKNRCIKKYSYKLATR